MLPLLFIYARKYFKLVFILIVITLISGEFLNLFNTYVISAVDNSKIGSSVDLLRFGSSGRIKLWQEAFWVGIEHPLTGVGQWNYIAVTKLKAGYPHNLLLEIWSQWGIPAFAAASIIITNIVKSLFRNRQLIYASPYYCIFIMMLVGGMIDGMINAMFKTSLGLFGCVFVFGFCLSIFVKKPLQQQEIKISMLSYIIISLGVVTSLFCIVILPLIYPPMWI